MKPMFQKRHYEAIALTAQDTVKYRTASQKEVIGVHKLLHELARSFQRDNPQFDAQRFLNACEPGANVRARGTS
jgi:hypothetical protein